MLTAEPKFRDLSSEEQGDLCLLYTNGGYGSYLGMVFRTTGGWCWETAIEGFAAEGVEVSRRLAKKALRQSLKEAGKL